MNIGNNGVCVHSHFGLNGDISYDQEIAHWSHVEDPEEPVQIRLPGRNHFFVIPRMEESGNSMPLASLDDLVLDFCDSPAIGRMVGGRARIAYGRANLRRQMIYPVTHGLAELIQLLSVHPPFQGSADISAV